MVGITSTKNMWICTCITFLKIWIRVLKMEEVVNLLTPVWSLKSGDSGFEFLAKYTCMNFSRSLEK
jgi:hypothetical protein